MNNPNFNGGWTDEHGYHVMRNNGRKVRFHRMVFENALGRGLSPDEVIHHEDGNKDNNELDNLRYFSSQGDHIRYHYENGLPGLTIEEAKVVSQNS